MNWQLGLSRFMHGWISHPTALSSYFVGLGEMQRPYHAVLQPRSPFTVERESNLLPALICALFDFEGQSGTWPPARVCELIDLAGLDHAHSDLHHLGPKIPKRFFRGSLPRGRRQTVILDGLAALDASLLSETSAQFEELSPTLRGYVLGAFERGDLGLPRDQAERFMDCMVETVTFAFLNFELELTPLPHDALVEARPC